MHPYTQNLERYQNDFKCRKRFYVFLIKKKRRTQQIAAQKEDSPQSNAERFAGSHPPPGGDTQAFPIGCGGSRRVNLKQ